MPSLLEKILLVLFGRSSLHKTPWGDPKACELSSQRLFERLLSYAKVNAESDEFNYYIALFNDEEVSAYIRGDVRLTSLKIYTNSKTLEVLHITPHGALMRVPVMCKGARFRIIDYPPTSVVFEFNELFSSNRHYVDNLSNRITPKGSVLDLCPQHRWKKGSSELWGKHCYKLVDGYFVDLVERSRESLEVEHEAR